jgi:hypothetical protein
VAPTREPDLHRAVPELYRSEPEQVRTQQKPCERCAIIAAYVDAEPEEREPVEHAHMVIEWYQKRGLFRFRLATNITKVYPTICDEKNVVPIGVNVVLAHLEEAGARKLRKRRKAPDKGTLQNRRGYWIPKPKPAKVVSIDRRQAS